MVETEENISVAVMIIPSIIVTLTQLQYHSKEW